ncbi:hypothetical protein K1X84_11145 [bacterium]|nr:hypothetical protein [bacterium]
MLKKTLAAVLILMWTVGCSKEVGSIEEFNGLVKKIQNKNEEIGSIQKEINDAVSQFNANRKADEQIVLPDTVMGLSKEQTSLIKNMIDKEQDMTYRGLLNQIIEKNDHIAKISNELEDVKAKLPKPYIVTGGDSHYKVCLDWLVKEKGLTKERANQLLEETALIDELVPGFNVWLYYNDGAFGTFVTQGTARISPNRFKYAIRKMQLDKAKEEGREEAKQEMKKDSTVAQ